MIEYRAGYKYQLAKDYSVRVPVFSHKDIFTEFINLDMFGQLTIKESYCWDGPSGPTCDDKTNMRGSLTHDALCQLCRMGLLDSDEWAETINGIFRTICREDGMNWFRAWYYFTAVNDFGKAALTKGNDPYPIQTAP